MSTPVDIKWKIMCVLSIPALSFMQFATKCFCKNTLLGKTVVCRVCQESFTTHKIKKKKNTKRNVCVCGICSTTVFIQFTIKNTHESASGRETVYLPTKCAS